MNKRAEPNVTSAAALEASAFWMPYTANRQFKKAPRLLARAEGMYYWTADGRQVLDGQSGLWCVNAGHCRPKIVAAVQKQVAQMDFAPTFNMGHPLAFEFADRLAGVAPEGFSRVFFTNSGSESADTALKIALAYHRARGEGHRFRLIGRERGYHGVNFGGMAVGGIPANRKVFGPGVAGVDHIRHTHDLQRNAFSRGQPAHGADFAEELERLCAFHDPSTIAAVIVEPVGGLRGVLVRPRATSSACARSARSTASCYSSRGHHRLRAGRSSVRLPAFGVMPDLSPGQRHDHRPCRRAAGSPEDIFKLFEGPKHQISRVTYRAPFPGGVSPLYIPEERYPGHL